MDGPRALGHDYKDVHIGEGGRAHLGDSYHIGLHISALLVT